MLNLEALKEMIEGSGLSYRSGSSSWIFSCPRCSKKDKLYIRKRDGRFICWSCATSDNYQGKPEYALKDLLGMPLAEVRERLYGFRGGALHDSVFIEVPELWDPWGPEDRDQSIPLPPKSLHFSLDYHPIGREQAKRGEDYLARRGISPQVAREFGLRYHPQEGRVIFPVEVNGALVGWQARYIGDTELFREDGSKVSILKIVTHPNDFRRDCWMFQDRIKGDSAILVEGPVDAIKCHLCPVPAVASMGKVISDSQIEALKNKGVSRVYLGLDPDVGHRELSALVRNLIGKGFEVWRMTPAKGYDDFGAMTPEDVVERFAEAVQLTGGEVYC